MATDYDAPRRNSDEDVTDTTLNALKKQTTREQVEIIDEDEATAAEAFELPGADLSGEELSVPVVPKQDDEFTCTSCFLVYHRTRLAFEKGNERICSDCA
ncbi:DUF4193 domain-containing protein [Gordonia zhaorongruii]|uniref:DUF4193 domain-containing protein n=1 Tax=Gordonia zhaorongruii TaxID=2597659 RepID=UPI00104A376B|nr:DUF4193 domain-containing protein [Gordonia zhaorongruii]